MNKKNVKPTVTLSCLPHVLEQKELEKIHNSIVEAAKDVPEFGIRDEDSMINLFNFDMMEYGLGREIVVKGEMLLESEKTTDEKWDMLAFRIGLAVKDFFKESRVQCTFEGFNGHKRGIWVSPAEKEA